MLLSNKVRCVGSSPKLDTLQTAYVSVFLRGACVLPFAAYLWVMKINTNILNWNYLLNNLTPCELTMWLYEIGLCSFVLTPRVIETYSSSLDKFWTQIWYPIIFEFYLATSSIILDIYLGNLDMGQLKFWKWLFSGTG